MTTKLTPTAVILEHPTNDFGKVSWIIWLRKVAIPQLSAEKSAERIPAVNWLC